MSAPDPNPALSVLVKDFHSPGGEGGVCEKGAGVIKDVHAQMCHNLVV